MSTQPLRSTRLRPLSRRSQMIAEGPFPFPSSFGGGVRFCAHYLPGKQIVCSMSADRPTVRPSFDLSCPNLLGGPPQLYQLVSGRVLGVEGCLKSSRYHVCSRAARICPHICCRHQMVVVSPTLDRCTCSLGSPIPRHSHPTRQKYGRDVGSVGCEGILLQWALSKGDRETEDWMGVK